MKSKTLLILFLLIGFTTDSFSQLSGTTYASAKATKKANWVYTISESPGFASTNQTGITFDIMNAFENWVEDNKGIQVTTTYKSPNANDFTKFLEVVKNSKGGVFGLSNTTITAQRKKVYNFSPPYITNIGMILTNNTVGTLSSISDISSSFSGMTAVTVKNSTNEKRLLDIKSEYYPALKIEYVPSFQKAVDMVIKDPKLFANVDFTYYLDGVQNRKPIKRHAAGDDKTEQFGILMPKSNDWGPLLAEFMEGFVDSTEYKKIIMSNLGPSAIKFFETLK